MDEKQKVNTAELADKFFGEIRELKKQIYDGEVKLKIYRSQMGYPEMNYETVKVNQYQKDSKIEFLIIKIEEIEKQIHENRQKLDRIIIDTNIKLEKLPNVQYQQVLTLLYIESFSLQKTSEIMAYSKAHIKRLRDNALECCALLEEELR